MKREDPNTAPAPGEDEALDRAIAEDAGQTAAELPDSDSTLVDPEDSYFDALMHERVQELHTLGIWTDLGRRWGGLWIRLRALHVRSVVVRREAAEQKARRDLQLDDFEPIPPSEGIEINKATVTMAVTGARGRIAPIPAQRQVAAEAGFIIESGPNDLELVRFSGGWHDGEKAEAEDQVRSFFAPTLDLSMPFLTTLIRASRQLQKVADDEIDRLGERFVFGRHVKLDWRD